MAEEHVTEISHRRRSLLRAATCLLPLATLPLSAFAHMRAPRRLRFYHTHTSEQLDIVYAENGSYLPDALAEIDHLLRDFRSGDVHVIDPRLLDLLHAVREGVGSNGRYEVISGFRSPATNQLLRSRSQGVAQKSLHLQGMAIDVRLTGTETSRLRRAAIALAAGGVGYYPASDFVHLDTGRVRSW
jgi:uncharacterized protein YcbK (DUF882 family)